MNVPKLRFKEFNDDWIEEKINELVELNPKNPNLPENFIYIDLESVSNGILLQEKILTKDDAPSRAQRQVKVNDILYQTVRPYQKNNLFIDKLSHLPYIASTGYAILREKNIYQKFLFNKLHTDSFVNEVLDNCTGTSYPAINSNDLGNIKIFCPNNFKEQKRIGDFLSLIDKKIELQTKKIEDLKLFKLKSFEIMIRKINEYKKIKQIGSLKNGYAFKNNLYDGKGLYNILTISNVTGNLYINNNFKNKYNFIPKDIQNHQILKEKDILISMTGNVGRVSFNKGKNNLLNQRVGVLELNESINRDYIFYMLSNKKFENKMIDCGQGAAQLNITKTDIENYKIPYPNKQKQLKITKILNCITQKIQLEENKLLKLKKLKKGLMQNMFV